MSNMLSQEEINELLGNSSLNNESNNNVVLTDEQKDVLGEVGNISMGTAATTLSSLLNHKVEISTPTVDLIEIAKLSDKYDKPCVGLKIDYKEGIVGSNLLILKQQDVKIIANLMMGGDGQVDANEELTELDLSAISEAMNQMIGSSSTSLSSMLNYKIDIDTPQAFVLNFEEETFVEKIDFGVEFVIGNTFRMVVENLIDSEIMQLLPMDFGLNMVEKLKGEQQVETPQVKEEAKPSAPQNSFSSETLNQNQYFEDNSLKNNQSNVKNVNNINVKPVNFQNFDTANFIQQKENIGIIQDVPLEVTVELGRTKKPIREILEFNPGTVIELDKIAGEPIDVLVNGKFIAKGEVVVIDESFGVRITDIIGTEERI